MSMLNRDPVRQLSNIDLSKLYFYSVGIVVTDVDIDGVMSNDPNASEIEIWPVEKIAITPPEITTKLEADVLTNKPIYTPLDSENMIEKVSVSKKHDRYHTIRARWLNFGDYNRITPPIIRKGEYVLLFRYSNADEFYWVPLYNDYRKRMKEFIIHAVSGKPMPDENETIDKMYYRLIDTDNQVIKEHTPVVDNEYTTYDKVLNTGVGYLRFEDGHNNYYKLDSTTDTWYISSIKRQWLSVGGADRADGKSDQQSDTQYDIDINAYQQYLHIYDAKNNSLLHLDTANSKLTTSINKQYHIAVGGKNPVYKDGTESGNVQYDIIIDSVGQTITIKDSKGNVVNLDSSSDTLSITVNKDVNITAGANVNVKAATNVDINAGSTVNVKGGSTVNVTAPTINIKGGQVNIN